MTTPTPIMETKTCTKCGIERALDEFRQWKNKSGNRIYRIGACRACKRAAQNMYRMENRDKCAKASADWKKKNPEKNAAHTRASYGRRKPQCREATLRWISEHRERYLLLLRDYGMRSKEALTDTYVAHTLRMSVLRAPKDLIALKRAQIEIYRATKQLRQTIKEKQDGRD